MFDSGTLSLFAAITIFVVVVAGRDLLAKRGLSKAMSQGPQGVAAISTVAALPLAIV